MNRLARVFPFLGLTLWASPVFADIVPPDYMFCALETQTSDGSQCEQCEWLHAEDGAFEVACGPLRERGLTERCRYGQAHRVALFCDRRGDYVALGRSRTTTQAEGDELAPRGPISEHQRAAESEAFGFELAEAAREAETARAAEEAIEPDEVTPAIDTSPPPASAGGCGGCRTAGAPSRGAAGWLLVPFLLGWLRRRSRESVRVG